MRKRYVRNYFDYKPDLAWGIPNVYYIWHGEWSDPEIQYKNNYYDYYDVEDYLWETYKDDVEQEYWTPIKENEDDDFVLWAKRNSSNVKALISELTPTGKVDRTRFRR